MPTPTPRPPRSRLTTALSAVSALALLLLVVALHLWLVWVGPFPGDHWALAQKEPPHPHIISAYSDFFQILEPAIVIPLFAVAMFLFLRRNMRAEAVGLFIAYCAVPVNEAFKLALGPSPLWLAAHQTSHDYPSGLVAFTTAVFGYLGLVAWRQHRSRWIPVIALVLIVASGPARVVTGIHLVSDVIGGYLLGGAILMLAWRLTLNRSPEDNPWNIGSSEARA